MSEITDLLSEINIPKDKAVLLEHALDKKYVARPGFPPLEWEKVNMIPIQQEQVRASERIESLRVQMSVKFEAMDDKLNGFKEEMHVRFQATHSQIEALDFKLNSFKEQVGHRFDAMDSKFDAIDSRFAALDDKFKMLMWMNGILMAMAFAMFSKIFFGF